jgi:hypothetical protein
MEQTILQCDREPIQEPLGTPYKRKIWLNKTRTVQPLGSIDKPPEQKGDHEQPGQMKIAATHEFWRTFAIEEAVIEHTTVVLGGSASYTTLLAI